MKKMLFYSLLATIALAFASCEEQEPNFIVSGSVGDHDYVDLGLPSGTLWATCNIGATTPEAYGGYYEWGETTTKPDYTKYDYEDGKIVLDPEDDVATAIWGQEWCIPTKKQWVELYKHCAWKWTTYNGVYGRSATGSNGNSIFLPAAGWRSGSTLVEKERVGNYWSSSIYEDNRYCAWRFCFDSSEERGIDYYIYFFERDGGRSVRAVLKK